MHSSISAALSTLDLSHLEDELEGLGVTEANDVLELEKEDLQGIGLNLVQIRKLQNALKTGSAPKVAVLSAGQKKALANPVTKKAVAVAAPTCPSGHALKKTTAEHEFYQCDGCALPIKKGTVKFGCKACDHDVCNKCGGGASAGASGAKGAKACRWCAKGECWSHPGGLGGGYDMGGGYDDYALPVNKPRKPPPTTPFKRKFLEFAEGEIDEADAEAKREELDVAIDGGPQGAENYYPPVSTFEELEALPQHCIEALNEMGITSPMPIQAQAIPILLGGDDLVGIAKTGSGKTLAYLLPAVAHIEAQDPIADCDLSPIVICLAPTRELAVQIYEEAEKLLSKSVGAEGSNHPDGLKACCIYGGMKKDGQLRAACGAHIVAATPGRLYEHVLKDDISMDRVTYFVLDEGDRMLEEGFESQVKVIANAIRPDRHMLFFSATWPIQVHRLAKAMCKGSKPPVRLRVGQNSDGSAKTRDDIVQEVVVFDNGDYDARDKEKKELMYAHTREALELEGTKVLVFVSRKDLCDEMSWKFNEEGFTSEAMHGGKNQDARLAVLERFKTGDTRLLCATDVMGRGLDIPTITHVVIYDMGDIEDYVHRIGRTARGPHGEGHALTLFEYDPRWPHLAEGLIKVMQQSNQDVPDELQVIADEVKEGKRETKAMKGAYGKLSGNQGGYDAIQKKTYGVEADGNAMAKW